MTQSPQPIPPPPPEVVAPSLTAPPTVPGTLGRRPKQSVWPNVIGVIGIIYAIGGIIAAGLQALSMLIVDWVSEFAPPEAKAQMEPMTEHWLTLVAIAAVSALIAIILLVGSSGLVSRKAWSRPVLLGWAAMKILMMVLASVHGYLMSHDMMTATQTQQATGPPAFIFDWFMLVSTLFNFVLYTAFPIFMLVWLNLSGPKRDVATWRSTVPTPA